MRGCDVRSPAFFSNVEAVAELFSEERRGAHSSSGLYQHTLHSVSRVLTLQEVFRRAPSATKKNKAQSATNGFGVCQPRKAGATSAAKKKYLDAQQPHRCPAGAQLPFQPGASVQPDGLDPTTAALPPPASRGGRSHTCSTAGHPMCRGPPWGRWRRRGTRHTTGGCDASGGGDRRDGDAWAGTTGPPALPDPRRRRSVPDPPWCATRAPRGAGLARPRRRGRRRLTGHHAAGAARCAWDGYSPSSCDDRFGELDMHGENYLHWLVTARVNSLLGKLSLGDGFRTFRTKGDDGERHRRRRQENRVFMSWRFDRPDFPDLESHSGCRSSGPDGR